MIYDRNEAARQAIVEAGRKAEDWLALAHIAKDVSDTSEFAYRLHAKFQSALAFSLAKDIQY